MTDLWSNVVYFLVWFFFPFVPAFLMFKFLPNRAIVTGPFKGLNVNLGGSFAGYFLLFVAIAWPITKLIKIQSENFEVWTISGDIIGEDNQPLDASAHPVAALYPPKVIDNTDFSFTIVGEQQTGDLITFDKIRIESGALYRTFPLPRLDYRRSRLDMDSTHWKIDYETRRAELKKPVVLKRVSQL